MFKENQLRTFLAVVQEGSISRAAQRVHVSQSTASLHMRELEDELGVLVLERTPEGARPTPAGELLAEYAGRLLMLQREARARVREKARGLPILRLGYLPGLVLDPLVEALAALARRLPEVELEAAEADRDDLLCGLRAGRLDLALLVGPVDAGDLRPVPLGSVAWSWRGAAEPGAGRRLLPGPGHWLRAAIDDEPEPGLPAWTLADAGLRARLSDREGFLAPALGPDEGEANRCWPLVAVWCPLVPLTAPARLLLSLLQRAPAASEASG